MDLKSVGAMLGSLGAVVGLSFLHSRSGSRSHSLAEALFERHFRSFQGGDLWNDDASSGYVVTPSNAFDSFYTDAVNHIRMCRDRGWAPKEDALRFVEASERVKKTGASETVDVRGTKVDLFMRDDQPHPQLGYMIGNPERPRKK